MRLRLIAGLVLAPMLSAGAQVGFLPSQSPYREIQHGSFFELNGGKIYGGGGIVGLGPRDGTSEGFQFALRAKNTLQFSFGIWTAGTHRTQIDPQDSVAKQVKGIVAERLNAIEFGIQLNLTGGKTWHKLAPYAGIGLGLVHGAASPVTDTSGYSFGTKVYFAPAIGTRLFLGQRAYLRLDVRALIWNLSYPVVYSTEPVRQPGTGTQSNAVLPAGLSSQYTVTPQLRVGLGFVL
jgi:hypothetical protein